MKKKMKALLALILLFVLIVGGFIAGIYLQIFDVKTTNEKLGLYKLPVVGSFFPKPEPKDNADAQSTDANADKSKGQNPANPAKPQTNAPAQPQQPPQQRKVLTQQDINQQLKAEQAAQQKRISQLASVYNEMKPQNAANVMKDLNDDMAVAILQKMDNSQAAQVLSAMDPEQSARLTRLLYLGTPQIDQSSSGSGQGGQNGQNGMGGGMNGGSGMSSMSN